MNKKALVWLCATLASTAFLACGDVEEKPSTTTSASSSSSTSSASSSSSSSGETGGTGGMGGAGGMGGVGGMGGMASSSSSSSASSSGSSSSSGGMPLINGCAQSTADDLTAMATVTIQFPALSYTPACIRVKAGTMVTFEGGFASHPLQGGAVTNGIPTADPNSPITLTNSGMSAMFTLSNAGTVPYYCTNHAASGMKGAIFVDP